MNDMKIQFLPRTHTPYLRYDFNPRTNQYLMERLGVNAAFNAGAIEWHGKICLISRIEGIDRKSFFAIAESENGVDNLSFGRTHFKYNRFRIMKQIIMICGLQHTRMVGFMDFLR